MKKWNQHILPTSIPSIILGNLYKLYSILMQNFRKEAFIALFLWKENKVSEMLKDLVQEAKLINGRTRVQMQISWFPCQSFHCSMMDLGLWGSSDRHCSIYQMRISTRQQGKSRPGGHSHSQWSCPHSIAPRASIIFPSWAKSSEYQASGDCLEQSPSALGPSRGIYRKGAQKVTS